LNTITPPTRSNETKAYGMPPITAVVTPSGSGPLSSERFLNAAVPVVLDALKKAAVIGLAAVICSRRSFESQTRAPVSALKMLNERLPIMCSSS
jgi:hypothetical protein